MPTQITPLAPSESDDPAVKQDLGQGRDGWWNDSNMFGVIGSRPGLLKSIVPVFGAFFVEVRTVFSDDEIVERVLACGIFNWGNKFNITMHMGTGEETGYGAGMEYRQEALT